jgi:hypothetical protein
MAHGPRHGGGADLYSEGSNFETSDFEPADPLFVAAELNEAKPHHHVVRSRWTDGFGSSLTLSSAFAS